MAAVVASHRDAACVCVCVQGDFRRARTIGHLCGRTENDRNSNHYSHSKKGASLAGRDRPTSGCGELSASLTDRARTGRNELEIDAFSRGLSVGLGGFC